jgi:hypothetical protein
LKNIVRHIQDIYPAPRTVINGTIIVQAEKMLLLANGKLSLAGIADMSGLYSLANTRGERH